MNCDNIFNRPSPTSEIDRRCSPFPCAVCSSCCRFWQSRPAFLQVRISLVACYHSPFWCLITCVVRRSRLLGVLLWACFVARRKRRSKRNFPVQSPSLPATDSTMLPCISSLNDSPLLCEYSFACQTMSERTLASLNSNWLLCLHTFTSIAKDFKTDRIICSTLLQNRERKTKEDSANVSDYI